MISLDTSSTSHRAAYQNLRRLLRLSIQLENCPDEQQKQTLQEQILDLLETVKSIPYSCPLLLAHYHLICTLLNIDLVISEQLFESPLYGDRLYTWGDVLYPKEACELAALLMILRKAKNFEGIESKINEITTSLLNTLDRQGEPIFPLFSQLDKRDLNEYRAAYMLFFAAKVSENEMNRPFFTKLALQQKKNLSQVEARSFFIDYVYELIAHFFHLPSNVEETIEEVSILNAKVFDQRYNFIARRTQNLTQFFSGSGCKSGLGYFKYKDVGVINYGPQVYTIGDASFFGICGKTVQHKFFRPFVEVTDKSLSLDSHHLISSKNEHGDLEGYEESSFSGLWLNVKQRGDVGGWTVSCLLEGMVQANVYFVFYLKAEHCLVNRSQKLRPRSLDRYKGPALEIECSGKEGKFTLQALQGAKFMEVIPLAGNDSFWGADYLAAYSFQIPSKVPFISTTHQWKVQLYS